jgi:hypothetical protein
MSIQSIQLDSFQHAKPRFSDTAHTHIDVLGTKRHISLQAPAYNIKREISVDNTAGFNTEMRFRLPSSGYLHHMELKCQLNITATKGYCNYIGGALVDEVEFKSDNEDIHKYKYPPVFQYYLNQLKTEDAIDRTLTSIGGLETGRSPNTADIYVQTPIPFYGDSICVPGTAPMNLSKFKKAPELIIRTRTLANCIVATSTGGAIDNAWLVCYMSETSSSQKQAHQEKVNDFQKSIDFYTNEMNTVATATGTFIDISGAKGQLKKLMVFNRLASTVDDNSAYFTNVAIDELKTRVDGSEDYVFKQAIEGQRDFIIHNFGKGYSSTLGYPYIVNYGYAESEFYGVSNVGGIHSGRLHKNEIKVTHSLGANGYIDVLAIRSAHFKYINGQLVRLL